MDAGGRHHQPDICFFVSFRRTHASCAAHRGSSCPCRVEVQMHPAVNRRPNAARYRRCLDRKVRNSTLDTTLETGRAGNSQIEPGGASDKLVLGLALYRIGRVGADRYLCKRCPRRRAPQLRVSGAGCERPVLIPLAMCAGLFLVRPLGAVGRIRKGICVLWVSPKSRGQLVGRNGHRSAGSIIAE